MKKLIKSTFLGAPSWLKLWSIYLFLMPFYVFSSGSIQPADVFIAIVGSVYIIKNKIKVKGRTRKILLKFLQFCIYLTVVNLALSLFRLGLSSKGLPWYLISAFYYYNLGVMAFAIMLYQRYGKAFLEVTFFSLILVAGLQIGLATVLDLGGGLRGTLFFTNPNQLGYYGLSAFAAILILDTVLRKNRGWIYLSLVLFSYLLLESVSKAALGSAFILILVYFQNNLKLNFRAFVSISGVIVGVFIIFTFTSYGSEFLENWSLREANQNTHEGLNVSEWEYRGYDRIINHPYYLILGAGEGAYNRFDTYIENHEMHSSIGTILFCYGIPGTFLFLRFVLAIFGNLPISRILYTIPLFSYGITHMGLRFTIFWIALILVPISQAEKTSQKHRRIFQVFSLLKYKVKI